MLGFYPTVQWYNHLIAFGLMFGALTTYWDSFPPNKGKDNFWMHGFFIGLAYVPYAISTGDFWGWVIRACVLAILMGGWCAYFGNVDVEEYGRGAFIGLTLPLLLL
jgi:hypothetical protein